MFEIQVERCTESPSLTPRAHSTDNKAAYTRYHQYRIGCGSCDSAIAQLPTRLRTSRKFKPTERILSSTCSGPGCGREACGTGRRFDKLPREDICRRIGFWTCTWLRESRDTFVSALAASSVSPPPAPMPVRLPSCSTMAFAAASGSSCCESKSKQRSFIDRSSMRTVRARPQRPASRQAVLCRHSKVPQFSLNGTGLDILDIYIYICIYTCI